MAITTRVGERNFCQRLFCAFFLAFADSCFQMGDELQILLHLTLENADFFARMKRCTFAALAILVAAMHVAVIGLLAFESRPHKRTPVFVSAIAAKIIELEPRRAPVVPPAAPILPVRPLSQAGPKARAGPSSMSRARRETVHPGQRENSIDATSVPQPQPQSQTQSQSQSRPEPASAEPAPLRLLLSEATRKALRDMERRRQPSFAERSNEVLNGTPRSPLDTRLSNGIASAARGDCLKGDFKGGGMGLLSLPALAVAGIKGECRR